MHVKYKGRLPRKHGGCVLWAHPAEHPELGPCPKTPCAAPGQCHTQGLSLCHLSPHHCLCSNPIGVMPSVKAKPDCATSCQGQQGNLLSQGSQGQRQRPNPGWRNYIHSSAIIHHLSHAVHYWQTEIELLSPHRASSIGFLKYARWQKFQGQHKPSNCSLTSLHVVQKLVF